jgi:hypothetical protein
MKALQAEPMIGRDLQFYVRSYTTMSHVWMVLAEATIGAFSFIAHKRSHSPFSYFLYFLPVITALPWLRGRQSLRNLKQLNDAEISDRSKSRMSCSIALGTIAAYSMLMMVVIVLELALGLRG